MKQNVLKIAAALPGIPMLLIALGLMLQPEQALLNLNMPMLAGASLSTQLGDMTAFFLCAGVFISMGAFHSAPRWLYAGAALFIVAAFARTLAWLAHGADLSIDLITVEVISTVWLVVCAKLMTRS